MVRHPGHKDDTPYMNWPAAAQKLYYDQLAITPFFLPYSAGGDKERLRTLVDHDYTDVWRIAADGSVDIRMSKRFFAQIHPKFPECTVLEYDLEELVRRTEAQILKGRLNATWFEAYVSQFRFCLSPAVQCTSEFSLGDPCMYYYTVSWNESVPWSTATDRYSMGTESQIQTH